MAQPTPGERGAQNSGRIEKIRQSARSVMDPLRRRVAATRARSRAWVAPVVEPLGRALRAVGRAVGRVADLVWRIPLIIAAVAMAAAGLVHARGDQELAWTLVTGGFAIGLLGVPIGLIAVGLGRREEPPGDPAQALEG